MTDSNGISLTITGRIKSKGVRFSVAEIHMAHEIVGVERGGKVWTIRKVHETEADEEVYRFWYLGMTPEERILAVAECTESCLMARGLEGLPGIRRVYRRLKCK